MTRFTYNPFINNLDAVSISSSPSGAVDFLTGNSGGPVPADGSGNINVVGDNATGIDVVGNPGTSTLTISGISSSTTQIGVIELATNAEAVAGSDSTKAITSTSLKAKLGTQTIFGLPIGGSDSGSFFWTANPNDGELLIGQTGLMPVLSTLTAGTGISIANGAGSITISNSGSSFINYTAVSTSPYVVLTLDDYLGVDCSSSTITIQLPNSTTTGRTFVIKDTTGSSGINNITVTTVGGAVTIDGSTSSLLTTAYESIELIFNGTSYEIY